MQTINVHLYTIDELSEQARQKAIEKHRECYDIDLSYTVEYIEEVLEALGFRSPKIAYSGFSSQGDGFSFVSDNWEYKKGMLDKVKQCTQDSNILDIAKQLQTIAKNTCYKLQFSINRTSYFHSHENTVQIENDPFCDFRLTDSQDNELTDIKNRLCRLFYNWLESDFDYQFSEGCIIEHLQANNYLFLESGKVWSV